MSKGGGGPDPAATHRRLLFAPVKCRERPKGFMKRPAGLEFPFLFNILYIYLFRLCHVVCSLSVPQPGIEPRPWQ